MKGVENIVALERDECADILAEQLKTLFEGGVNMPTIGMATNLIGKLPDQIFFHAGCEISMLLVVPFKLLSFQDQLRLVTYRPKGVHGGPSKPAFSYLEEKNLRDVEGFAKTPTDAPYIIVDVDSGDLTLNLSPNNARQKLREINRSPVTVSQGVALAIHTPSLFHETNIYLAGSEIKDPKTGEYFTPDLWIYADQIKMKRDSSDDADPRWRTPSYGSIITL